MTRFTELGISDDILKGLDALGFEDPTNDERREQLARNTALKNGPER